MALTFLWKMIKGEKFLWLYFFIQFISEGISLVMPLSLGNIVGTATAEDSTLKEFVISCLIYIGLEVSKHFLSYINQFFKAKAMPALRSKTTKYLYDQVKEKSISFIIEHNSADLANKIERMGGKIEGFIGVISRTVINIVMFVGYLAIIYKLLPELLGILIVVSVLFVLMFYRVALKQKEMRIDIEMKGDKFSALIIDTISNMLLVKSFNGITREDHRFNESLKDVEEGDVKSIKFAAFSSFIHFSLHSIVMTLVLSYCGYLLFKGDISVAYFVTLNLMLSKCGGKIRMLVYNMKWYVRMAGTIDNILKIVFTESDVQDVTNAKKLKLKKAEIKIDNVDFKYDSKSKLIFKDFNLEIPAKQKLGLVGRSGEGKSTLVKILQRFHDITNGSIKFDGQDIKDVTQESLREYIAYIPQEPSLFSRSIYDNIAYAKPEATKEEVYKAAKLANADEFIEELPDKYDELVGERGFKLSGGQRQRIAIARAILKDCPIIVMDEATSALDSHSEKLIQESLEKLMKDKTCIVIAHRLSTIKNMDRIIVLEEGKIIQDGTHLSLVRKDGIYKQLWNLQYGGLIAEE
ncbi:MAG: ABC transporter ATP-binding protein [Proteobacteria bacterium]|nr:ABC transporter ATP-binding protein [Pseudomonadota bacterium]